MAANSNYSKKVSAILQKSGKVIPKDRRQLMQAVTQLAGNRLPKLTKKEKR